MVDLEVSRSDSDPHRFYSDHSGSENSEDTLTVIPFGFVSKTKYDANESLITIRSDNFRKKDYFIDDDIWKRPPPDFRPQVFAPKPPKRNSRDSMKPWNYGTIPGQRETIKRPKIHVIPHILIPKKKDDGRMVTRFHIDRPFTAKKKFVSEGMNKPGEYEMPQPPDFRQYPSLKKLGLSEFDTDRDHDPYNIHFHTGRLNIIHGERFDRAADRAIKGLQMAPPVKQLPRWEANLILPKEPFPIKPGELNRHRIRHRPARSAFMERISRTLEMDWAKEKLDMEINKMKS